MLFKEKIGVRSVRLALGVIASSVMMSGQAMAQATPDNVQRVEITGSSIKRILKEGSLPVQIISKETIARTGATTVADLVQKLPAMQGFTIEAIAAGTNSGGRTTASIHDLGSSYTLILLNGRRIAPLQDSGAAVNLNSIPMSAVERVEVLTDGASALYGADAIAGVINFILKKNYQGLQLDAGYALPEHPGGKNSNVSATYGFGDLDKDGYNVLLSYRHDTQQQLKATQRNFAKTSYIPFNYEGKDYIYDRSSVNSTPANATIRFTNAGIPTRALNPYALENGGKCGETNVVYTQNDANNIYCSFDFAATVEIVPESKRDTVFGSGRFKLNDNATLFGDVSLGRFDLTARIAANPVNIVIPTTSALYTTHVAPFLTTAQKAAIRDVTANYRGVDFGTRDSQTLTDVRHVVGGIEGNAFGWDYNSAVTLSKYQIDERYTGGYMLNTEFRAMITSLAFDPFLGAGKQSDATKTLIKNSMFTGSIREAYSDMKSLDLRASREVFQLPGGAASVGLGADYRELHQVQTATTAAKNGSIYAFSAPSENDYTRTSNGAFAELAMPVLSNLDASAAVRYDRYSAIDNALANRTVGKSANASTYKLSLRYTPVSSVLLRASYGTGFKVADQDSIAGPVVNAGVTAANFQCPAWLRAEKADYCYDIARQYPVKRGGNENLRPEKSKQFAMGFRIDASSNVTFGADLWDVKMTDQVASVSAQQAFTDTSGKFRQLFSTFADPATGNINWAFLQAPLNIGRSHNRGIDWDLTVGEKYAFGKFSMNIMGTHMLKSSYTKPGTDNEWTDSMDYFGINDSVTFRNIIRATPSLETGKLLTSFSVNYRNGYTDAIPTPLPYNVTDKANTTVPFRLQVPSYITVDYQGKYVINKMWDVRVGVKNLFDKAPPLSLRASSGHQVGYDPRYTDAMGRTMYFNTSYKFW